MAIKKYLSLDGLTEYDALVKAEINKKSDSSHTHDGRYYTETEIDTKVNNINSTLNGSIKSLSVSGRTITYTKNDGSTGTITTQDSNTDTKVTNTLATTTKAYITGTTSSSTNTGSQVFDTGVYLSTTAGELVATKFTGALNGNASTATSATSAASATKATQDASGNVITSTYETKSAATSKLSEAKTYADNAAAAVKNDLLNGAGEAYDTLKELGDLIDDNADAIDALETVAAGKANATHSHGIADVTGLQSALDGKAASTHGTHVSYSTTAPVMDGTASVGSASTVARSDHKHPTDTSRASQADLDALETVVSGKAASSHTHTISNITNLQSTLDAKTNQNAFSYVKVGDTSVAADTTTDTLTLAAGSNITITPDATNDKITIASTNTTYSAGTGISLSGTTFSNSGVRSISTGSTNGTISVNTGGTTTNISVKGLGGAAYTSIDSALSSTSTNSVQNKVVNNAISTATSAISANTTSINAHTTRISALETKVGDGFTEITSDEISALFTA